MSLSNTRFARLLALAATAVVTVANAQETAAA